MPASTSTFAKDLRGGGLYNDDGVAFLSLVMMNAQKSSVSHTVMCATRCVSQVLDSAGYYATKSAEMANSHSCNKYFPWSYIARVQAEAIKKGGTGCRPLRLGYH